MIWIAILALLGGATTTFAKIALEGFPVYTYLFLRFAIALIILLPMFIKSKEKITRKDLLKIILVSLLGTGNVIFFSFGVRYTTATVSQLFYAIVPIIVMILSALILKTKISKQKILGVLLGFFGIIIITIVPNLNNNIGSGTIIGNMLVLVAVISYSFYTVLSKKLQEKFSPLSLTTMMALTTMVIQVILIPFDISKYNNMIVNISIMSIIGLLYVGAIGTALYYFLYQKIIKKTNPITASLLYYLQPICTFLYSYVLLNEKLNLSILAGTIFIFVGAGLVMYEKKINKKDCLNEKRNNFTKRWFRSNGSLFSRIKNRFRRL